SYRAVHAAPRWVPASTLRAGLPLGLTGAPQAFRVSASPAATRTFRAALASRSWLAPHARHVHSRTPSGLGPSFTPQAEHTWLVGSNRPIVTT
ncbi:MAG TPA: hypothetical protein VIJ07_12900, partial [Dermatophilaceae bacterium]